MSRRAAIALGSNQGDPLAELQRARAALGRLGAIVATSSLYRTAPVGGPPQDDYLNAVVVVDTSLAPLDLLGRLQAIETGAGRVRTVRWGPRVLDLDIVTVVDGSGQAVSAAGERLTLPHPRAGVRRFVLEPLAEVWPEAPVGGGATAASRLAEVGGQEVGVVAGPGWHTRRPSVPDETPSLGFAVAQILLIGLYGWACTVSSERPRIVHPWALVGALGGVVLALAASRSLGSALSPYPEPVPGSPLSRRGPYRWLRHPVYGGILLFLAGIATAFAAWPALGVTAVLAGFFSMKARHEEARLRAAHPGYDEYARRVRGGLVPRPGGGG
jgi:2-amino-4-hydroxy-6-hydroxymethyldihydropteridine diphosphokinase